MAAVDLLSVNSQGLGIRVGVSKCDKFHPWRTGQDLLYKDHLNNHGCFKLLGTEFAKRGVLRIVALGYWEKPQGKIANLGSYKSSRG